MVKEKILYARGKSSTNQEEQTTEGVLVIDPNKVFDDDDRIADRYVKQEDLNMFAMLKAYKRSRSIITVKDNQSSQITINPIVVNFLNPIKNKNADGTPNFKNKLTTDWTDFFTSQQVRDEMLDPESFGISSIEIAINANLVPVIKIVFIDVQGRVLFERGNDENNPYNIFFTYPYPRFLLLIKGYYGRALEIPLVLLKSNTNFDSGTGNYTTTAEFQSEIFALFNNFLTIYAYVAPYMFQLDNGEYLGRQILCKLYERQNKSITERLRSLDFAQNDIDKYIINDCPTLVELGSAITKVPTSLIHIPDNATISTQSDKLIDFKKIIITNSNRIVSIIKNNPKTISGETKIAFDEHIKQINDAWGGFNSDGGYDYQEYDEKNRLDVDRYVDLASLNNAIKEDLYRQTIGGEILYTTRDFDRVIKWMVGAIDFVQEGFSEKYVINTIQQIGTHLGYQPNLSNVLRIIANNFQTFLILLEIISRNAQEQIRNNDERQLTQSTNSEHKSGKEDNLVFSVFPSYKKPTTKLHNGQVMSVVVEDYPGVDPSNANWFEVAFIEEIYKSIQNIHNILQRKPPATIPREASGLLSLFALGDINLTPFGSSGGATNHSTVVEKLIQMFCLYVPYSNMFYQNNPTETTKVSDNCKSIADFQIMVMNRTIINQIKDDDIFLFKRNVVNILKPTDTSDVNFIYNLSRYINDSDVFPDILKQTKREIELYSNYNLSGDEHRGMYDEIYKEKSDIITNLNMTEFYHNITQMIEGKSALYYSLNHGIKEQKLTPYINLRYNHNYDSIYSGDMSGLNERGSTDMRNPFGGFLLGLNQKVYPSTTPVDFNRLVQYGRENVVALTDNIKPMDDEYKNNFNSLNDDGKFIKIEAVKFNQFI